MSLVDYSSDSNDTSTENDINTISAPDVGCETRKLRLPPPPFTITKDTAPNQNTHPIVTAIDNIAPNSVFKNHFVVAEHQEKAALERHVKMIDRNEMRTINGRKVCWNYRKGRCRFGHNCKFAHDSDVEMVACNATLRPASTTSIAKQPPDEVVSDDNLRLNKRKRPGLTQGLIPGKKVLKTYAKCKLTISQ